jgi:hypothetical protein
MKWPFMAQSGRFGWAGWLLMNDRFRRIAAENMSVSQPQIHQKATTVSTSERSLGISPFQLFWRPQCATRSSRWTAISSLLISIPENALPHVHRNQHVWHVDRFGYMQVARD